MAAIQQTKNAHLQATLNSWVELLAQACQLSSRAANPQGQGPFREEKIDEFVRSFVPLDVEEADIEHYGNNLKQDEVHTLPLLILLSSFLRGSNPCFLPVGVLRLSGARALPVRHGARRGVHRSFSCLPALHA